jgi:predicted TIM-barrel fold metal-dependent hydrolase
MMIADGQIHLWDKGTPSAHHRQEPYSAEQAIAGMDAAGVDRALVHPVLWDPGSNELAVEAERTSPNLPSAGPRHSMTEARAPNLTTDSSSSRSNARPI